MPTDDANVDSDSQTHDGDRPSARQLLHAATGDREAEAKALADRAPDAVSDDDAKRAVKLAQGDIHGEPRPEHDVATPQDAEAVRAERSGTDR